ncbi:MAG TPA: hypothetical protein VJ720_09165 [Chitinophaga sp.]|nr:hypothetical protein [Chitinophaga sp.]
MKKLLFALLVLAAQQAWAQHGSTETLFGSGKPGKIGGYGMATTKFTSIDDNLGVIVGAHGGVFLNKRWMLGAAGYSLVNNISLPVVNTGAYKEYLNFWYTGLVVEYTHNSDKLVHWNVGTLLGGGGVGRRNKWHDDFDDNDISDGSGFFIAEPFANLELNITKFLRLDVGASYRHIQGSSTVGISDSKLSGPSLQVGIKAGKF